jgi:hypothetical protein
MRTQQREELADRMRRVADRMNLWQRGYQELPAEASLPSVRLMPNLSSRYCSVR